MRDGPQAQAIPRRIGRDASRAARAPRVSEPFRLTAAKERASPSSSRRASLPFCGARAALSRAGVAANRAAEADAICALAAAVRCCRGRCPDRRRAGTPGAGRAQMRDGVTADRDSSHPRGEKARARDSIGCARNMSCATPTTRGVRSRGLGRSPRNGRGHAAAGASLRRLRSAQARRRHRSDENLLTPRPRRAPSFVRFSSAGGRAMLRADAGRRSRLPSPNMFAA